MFIRGKSRFEIRIWGYICFGVVFWQIGSFGFATAKTKEMAFYWWQFAHIGTMLVPPLFFQFICIYLEIRKKWLQISAYAISVIFIVINFYWGRYFIGDLRLTPEKFYFIDWFNYRNPLFIIYYVLAYALLLGYSYLILARAYRVSHGIRRKQLQYLIIGTIVAWSGPIGIIISYFRTDLYVYTNLLMGIFPIIMGYAIVRHQLMDIEVIIKKTLVFTGLLAFVFVMLILPTLLIQEYILRSATWGSRIIGLIISGVVIILTMHKIESFLINVTDRYLFQKKYDYMGLLKTFTSEVLTVLKIDDLLNLTVDKLTDLVKLNSCAVLLFDNEKQQFDVRAFRNMADPSVSLVKMDSIVAFLDHTHGYILKADLTSKKIFIPKDIQVVMDKLSSELVIPMILHEKIIGILSMGKKKSDEDYTQNDLDILLPLAGTLAIAVSNAELFAELGKTQAEAAQKEKMAVIGTLSAGINHEICNPLGIARGQCEAFLLNMKDGFYNKKTSEELLLMAQLIMTKVIKETDRATAITKKLSSFAKPAKGESEMVDINKEIDEVFGLVNYELKLDKIEIEKDIDKNLPRIFVDRKQFQEVLFNLMRNAAQSISDNGRITVSAKNINEKIMINIQDTGSGIAPEKIKELFNPFFTTKEPGKGTGLGLFIVRQVVEKNGGRIYVKNTKVGEGTTFTIELPVLDCNGIKV